MSPCVSPWLLTQMSLNLTTWLCVSDSIEDFRSLAEQAYRPSLVDKLYANVAKKQRAPRKAKKFASETGKTPHDKSRWHIGFISIHTISFYLWTEEEYEVGAILARRLKKSWEEQSRRWDPKVTSTWLSGPTTTRHRGNHTKIFITARNFWENFSAPRFKYPLVTFFTALWINFTRIVFKIPLFSL